MVRVMSQDVFTLFGEMTTENLMETITKSMDDFLYVFDIQNNKIEISQSAVDRFMIYNEYGRWDGSDLTDGIHSTAGRNRIDYSGRKIYTDGGSKNVLRDPAIYRRFPDEHQCFISFRDISTASHVKSDFMTNYVYE